ncbi:MAG TPA: PHB depolymerase family esterase [Polyangia bacterium]|nr:PHB depolymerase family esterase [Polyangia bacterium]
MRLRRFLFAFAAVSACLFLAARYWLHFPRPADPHLAGSFTRETLQDGGRDRSFGVYVPARRAAPTPLVVALHESGGKGEAFRWHTGYDFDRLADENGFVVAYPDGFEGHWDDCRAAAPFSSRKQHVDDVAFIRAMIRRLAASVHIDPAQVFAVGHSNGGQMALRLALEAPDAVSGGVAVVSAGLPADDNLDCHPSGKQVPVLIMNGTADRLNPFAGGRMRIFGVSDRGNIRSTPDSARYFVALNGLPDAPSVERLPGGDDSIWAERSLWSAPGRPRVELVTIHGGGHVVPQPYTRYPRVLGPMAPGFDGPLEIWRFFSAARGPAAPTTR